MNLKKASISGLKWNTIGTIGRSIFQLLQISILTRFLPKEAFGLIAMALFIVNFTNIFVDMGFTSAILHRKIITQNEYSSIYWLNLLIAIFIYGIIILFTPLFADFYGEAELKTIIPILGVNILIMAAGRMHLTILQKAFKFKNICIIDLSAFFIGLISALLFVVNDFGVYSLVYSTLISSFISSFLLIITNIRIHPVKFHYQFKETKPFLKIGSYAMGSQFISFFSTDIDILIVGKLLGTSQLGLYSLSKQIILKIYSIINPIVTKVLSPLLSTMQDDKNLIKKYFLRITSLLSTINIPIYLLIAVLSKEILTLLYGVEYSNAIYILSFLSIAYCTNTLFNPVGSLQIATGRTDIGFRWAVFSLTITPLVIYFSALSNINTVAFARALLSLLLIVPLWWIQLKPMINLQLKEYLKQFATPHLLFLIISCTYLMSLQFYELPFGTIFNALIKGSISMLLFVAFLWVVDKKRIKELQKMISSLYANYK